MKELKAQVKSFIEALNVVKENKGMKDYDLFEKGKITEEQIALQIHQTSCTLKIQDTDLALQQAKTLDEYFHFVQHQQSKIVNTKKKLQSLTQELEHLKKLSHDQLQKAYIDNQEIARLSDNLKDKIESTSYKQDNHLEQLYTSRQKILNDELEKETKEKQGLMDRLRKKKDENKKLKDQLMKY